MEPANNPSMPPPPPSNRLWEGVCVALNLGLSGWLAALLWSDPPGWTGGLASALVGTWLLADLVSGTVHWFADTWGRSDWPVLGPTLIHSFREHHVLPDKITEHGWIETNGACCMVCLPALAAPLLFGWGPLATAACLHFNFWIVMTNQVHKWAHAGESSWPVRAGGKAGLLLTPAAHARHHAGDHTTDYAITSGVLNPLLDRAGFFRGLERLVTAVTGWKPREDDGRALSTYRRR